MAKGEGGVMTRVTGAVETKGAPNGAWIFEDATNEEWDAISAELKRHRPLSEEELRVLVERAGFPYARVRFVDYGEEFSRGAEWIRLRDRLPVEGEEVLLLFNGKIRAVGRWTNIGESEYVRWYHISRWYNRKEVTHWQPLPGLPEEE